jgi:hypothetical protein
MTEPYRLPTATVLAVELSRDVATVTIEISREDYLGYPIAPADLRQLDTHASVFPLHQLIGREGPRLVFETHRPAFPAPQVARTYEFCSWWIPNAMDAVRDMSAKWERLTYPGEGDHDHCLLTYETIAACANHKEGYRSSYGWITVEAYCEFIERDSLRVRSKWWSIE